MNLNQKKKPNEDPSSKMDACGAAQKSVPTQPMNSGIYFPRFIMITRVDGANFNSYNPFVLSKFLDGLLGRNNSVKKVKDGLLVEVSSEKQSKSLLALDKIIDVPVKCNPHKTLNSCKGVVYCRDLLNSSDEDILEGLQSYGVSAVRRIKTKKDNVEVETGSFILTFEREKIPSKIRAAIYSLDVRPYIPQPMKCFRCQRFGHIAQKCTQEPVCACGLPPHEDTPCTNNPKCVNCNGPHTSRYAKCPILQREREIKKLMTLNKTTYGEAKKQLSPSFLQVKNDTSYAKVASTPKIDVQALAKELLPILMSALTPILQSVSAKTQQTETETFVPPKSRPPAGCSESQPEKRKRDASDGTYDISSGDEDGQSSSSMSATQSQSSVTRKRGKGWPKGKPRKPPS
jgi:hypothetical protein